MKKPPQRRTNKKNFESASEGDNTSLTLVNNQFSDKSLGLYPQSLSQQIQPPGIERRDSLKEGSQLFYKIMKK